MAQSLYPNTQKLEKPTGMSNPVPPWDFRASSGGKQVKGSSRNATDGAVLPVSGAHHSNSWFQISDSSTTNGSEADSFRDILGLLSHAPLHSTSQAASTTVPGRDSVCAVDEGESSGKKRTSDGVLNRRCYSEGLDAICEELKTKVNDRPKRTRSAELHNMSERRRRDRIKEKMRALQELIPNCNKFHRTSVLDDALNYHNALKIQVELDRASMLDDAISYLKLLKLQVEMLSMGGGALCQVPCMSPAGIHNTQFPQLSPFVPLRPGIGMGLGAGVGMVGVCYSPTLHASLSAAAGLPLISAPGNIPVPQVQVPFIHSQSLPEVAAPSSLLPAFVTGFSPACNCSNQGLYSSQNIATGVTDYQANPIFSNSEM